MRYYRLTDVVNALYVYGKHFIEFFFGRIDNGLYRQCDPRVIHDADNVSAFGGKALYAAQYRLVVGHVRFYGNASNLFCERCRFIGVTEITHPDFITGKSEFARYRATYSA